MNKNLLKDLDAIIAQDKIIFQKTSFSAIVESQLAAFIVDDKLSEIQSIMEDAYQEVQETLSAIKAGCYPFHPKLVIRISKKLLRLFKNKHLPEFIAQVHDIYGINESYLDAVNSISSAIKKSVEFVKPLDEISFPEDWPLHKVALSKRVILLGLSRTWGDDNSDEPLLWETSATLETTVGCSLFAVNEAFTRVCLSAGTIYNVRSQKNLSSFFAELNDDKAGNILDNLLISKLTYQTMLEEGWQPDRYEVQNLPMSIGMLLEFMEKKGFSRVRNIGDVLEINLKEATENLRYRGSPFLSEDDLKTVRVIVPGWERDGDLIIRPKVSEISS